MPTIVSAIYKIVNKVNGKLYVGSAANIRARWTLHKQNLKRGQHHSDHLQKAWDKYGSENFSFEVIEQVSDLSKLIECEQHWIDHYASTNPDKGYNICPVAGSVRGIIRSEETRKRMSIAKMGHEVSEETRENARKRSIGNTYNLGKKRTPEQIENIRQGHLGQVIPDWVRQKSYEVRIQKPYWNKGLTKETDSRIAKMSASRTGQVSPNKDLWKRLISPKLLEEIKAFYLDWHTVSECSEKFGFSAYSLRLAFRELGIIRDKSEATVLFHKRRKK